MITFVVHTFVLIFKSYANQSDTNHAVSGHFIVFIKYLQRFFHDVFWKGGENIEVKVFTYLNV